MRPLMGKFPSRSVLLNSYKWHAPSYGQILRPIRSRPIAYFLLLPEQVVSFTPSYGQISSRSTCIHSNPYGSRRVPCALLWANFRLLQASRIRPVLHVSSAPSYGQLQNIIDSRKHLGKFLDIRVPITPTTKLLERLGFPLRPKLCVCEYITPVTIRCLKILFYRDKRPD